jgi:hypothetical protein
MLLGHFRWAGTAKSAKRLFKNAHLQLLQLAPKPSHLPKRENNRACKHASNAYTHLGIGSRFLPLHGLG